MQIYIFLDNRANVLNKKLHFYLESGGVSENEDVAGLQILIFNTDGLQIHPNRRERMRVLRKRARHNGMLR